jgi:hypothetical protein
LRQGLEKVVAIYEEVFELGTNWENKGTDFETTLHPPALQAKTKTKLVIANEDNCLNLGIETSDDNGSSSDLVSVAGACGFHK